MQGVRPNVLWVGTVTIALSLFVPWSKFENPAYVQWDAARAALSRIERDVAALKQRKKRVHQFLVSAKDGVPLGAALRLSDSLTDRSRSYPTPELAMKALVDLDQNLLGVSDDMDLPFWRGSNLPSELERQEELALKVFGDAAPQDYAEEKLVHIDKELADVQEKLERLSAETAGPTPKYFLRRPVLFWSYPDKTILWEYVALQTGGLLVLTTGVFLALRR